MMDKNTLRAFIEELLLKRSLRTAELKLKIHLAHRLIRLYDSGFDQYHIRTTLETENLKSKWLTHLKKLDSLCSANPKDYHIPVILAVRAVMNRIKEQIGRILEEVALADMIAGEEMGGLETYLEEWEWELRELGGGEEEEEEEEESVSEDEEIQDEQVQPASEEEEETEADDKIPSARITK